MHNTGVGYNWKFGCCCTVLLESHLQANSSIKWKHFSINKEEKAINLILPAIKIIKTGVYMPPIFSTLPA